MEYYTDITDIQYSGDKKTIADRALEGGSHAAEAVRLNADPQITTGNCSFLLDADRVWKIYDRVYPGWLEALADEETSEDTIRKVSKKLSRLKYPTIVGSLPDDLGEDLSFLALKPTKRTPNVNINQVTPKNDVWMLFPLGLLPTSMTTDISVSRAHPNRYINWDWAGRHYDDVRHGVINKDDPTLNISEGKVPVDLTTFRVYIRGKRMEQNAFLCRGCDKALENSVSLCGPFMHRCPKGDQIIAALSDESKYPTPQELHKAIGDRKYLPPKECCTRYEFESYSAAYLMSTVEERPSVVAANKKKHSKSSGGLRKHHRACKSCASQVDTVKGCTIKEDRYWKNYCQGPFTREEILEESRALFLPWHLDVLRRGDDKLTIPSKELYEYLSKIGSPGESLKATRAGEWRLGLPTLFNTAGSVQSDKLYSWAWMERDHGTADIFVPGDQLPETYWIYNTRRVPVRENLGWTLLLSPRNTDVEATGVKCAARVLDKLKKYFNAALGKKDYARITLEVSTVAVHKLSESYHDAATTVRERLTSVSAVCTFHPIEVLVQRSESHTDDFHIFPTKRDRRVWNGSFPSVTARLKSSNGECLYATLEPCFTGSTKHHSFEVPAKDIGKLYSPLANINLKQRWNSKKLPDWKKEIYGNDTKMAALLRLRSIRSKYLSVYRVYGNTTNYWLEKRGQLIEDGVARTHPVVESMPNPLTARLTNNALQITYINGRTTTYTTKWLWEKFGDGKLPSLTWTKYLRQTAYQFGKVKYMEYLKARKDPKEVLSYDDWFQEARSEVERDFHAMRTGADSV